MDTPTPLDPRTALALERERALGELAELAIEAPGQMTYGSQAAAASHVFEQQRDLALRDHTRQHLAEIDAALGRLDRGSYGTCTSCGNAIAPERLEALPWTPLCIECSRSGRRR